MSSSELSRAHALDPRDIAAHSGEVVVPILRDDHDILDAHSPHALVALQHIVVDEIRVAYRREEVRGEVDPGLDRLPHRTVSRARNIRRRAALTTTIPSSSGSLNLKYA